MAWTVTIALALVVFVVVVVSQVVVVMVVADLMMMVIALCGATRRLPIRGLVYSPYEYQLWRIPMLQCCSTIDAYRCWYWIQ